MKLVSRIRHVQRVRATYFVLANKTKELNR